MTIQVLQIKFGVSDNKFQFNLLEVQGSDGGTGTGQRRNNGVLEF